MVFVPVPNVAEIELIYSWQGQRVENVLHYAGANVSDAAVLTALCYQAATSWSAAWASHLADDLGLVMVAARSLESQSAPAVEVPMSPVLYGARGDANLPTNCAACISCKTAKRGRSYRGRIYLPGLTLTAVSGSSLTNAEITFFQNSYSVWDYLDLSGEPYAMGVVSRYHNGAPRSIGDFENITAFVMNPYVASQRRRLPGRGE